jgi:hypothetical protein
MTTILTSSNRYTVTAISPSGKRATLKFGVLPCLEHHKKVASILAPRIGLDPATLIHGETKQGFAFTPAPRSPQSPEQAAQLLMQVSPAFSGYSPTVVASAINELTKKP